MATKRTMLRQSKAVSQTPDWLLEKLSTPPRPPMANAIGPHPVVRKQRLARALEQLRDESFPEELDQRHGWQKIPKEEMPQMLMNNRNIRATENWVQLMEGIYDSQDVTINDPRTVNATGMPIGDGNKKNPTVPANLIEAIAGAAVKNGEDPYTWLAMGLQETTLDWDRWNRNMFHIRDLDRIEDWGAFADAKDATALFQSAFDFWNQKKKERPKNKVTEAEQIQGWNGYGTITPDNNEYPSGKLYGVDLPIDFDKDPVYGKTIINLRDSVIKQNPEVVRIVEQARKKYGR